MQRNTSLGSHRIHASLKWMLTLLPRSKRWSARPKPATSWCAATRHIDHKRASVLRPSFLFGPFCSSRCHCANLFYLKFAIFNFFLLVVWIAQTTLIENRPVYTQYSLCVLFVKILAAGGTPPVYGFASVVITIEDVNDNSPYFPRDNPTSVVVPFNLPHGASVVRIGALDTDEGLNGTVGLALVEEVSYRLFCEKAWLKFLSVFSNFNLIRSLVDHLFKDKWRHW